jgi:acyl-CoA thioester hydrolase
VLAMDVERFELPLTATADDIDELGHVNNVVYVRWIQEAAVAHWQLRAAPEDQKKLVWVVVRHEIDYRRPAREGDHLLARTWVGAESGPTFERFTEIVRADTGAVLARGRTLWCPVDAGTGRHTRVSASVRHLFSAG